MVLGDQIYTSCLFTLQVEIAEQWRNAILEQLALLRSQPRRELDRSLSRGRGLGLGTPPWVTPPEGPPPALREIDLRAVDKMLSHATWVSAWVSVGFGVNVVVSVSVIVSVSE